METSEWDSSSLTHRFLEVENNRDQGSDYILFELQKVQIRATIRVAELLEKVLEHLQ